ncbi:serine protease grass-like [Portunus trituberculatus]|uniref:serine protease grass-like n=1 Tax=Portunus trituberculatus TaxID=210409 RepID=UPI001E1CB881|nr:serine protease grass-like [Portunus trituberculatus]
MEMEKKKQTLEQMKGEPMGMKYDTGEGKEKAEGSNKLKSYQLLGEYLLPDKSKCGKRARKSYRVFFGEDAPLNAYPWMALLGYRNPDKPHWLCGGSLINDRYVLSAGHCVHPESIRKSRIGQLLKVRLGEHDLSKKIDCPQDYIDAKECAPPPLDFKPESITIHPDYSPTLLINDISLIRLGKPVTFTHAIRPVCLPQSDLDVSEFLGYRDAVVAGWGSTENTLQSKILQRAPIPYQKRAACEVEYLSYLGEGQLCFGGRNRQDSCFGDSGGPVMQSKAGTGQYTQLGIVSYGKKICGTVGVPAVYTNVAHYRSWILQCLKP